MKEILLSNIPGKVPSINQLEITQSGMGYNRADGKLYSIKVVDGSKTVVLLATGLPATEPGSENITVHEKLIGMVDGVNCVFASTVPFVPGKISVFVNGLKEHFFEETAESEITLSQAPVNVEFPDTVEAIYTIQ